MGVRTTLSLLALLALTAVAYFYLRPQDPSGEGGPPRPWPADFEPLEATRLQLHNQARGMDLEMRFERESPGHPWRMTFPLQDEAETAQVHQILSALQHNPWQLVGKASEIEAEVLSEMGLVDASGAPAARGLLRIGQAGRELLVYLGGPDVDERLLFVRLDDRVWRTPVNLWSAFEHNIQDFRSSLVFSFGSLQIDRVVLERVFGSDGVAGQRLEFFRGGLGRWWLREGELETRADETAVDGLIAALLTLRIRDFVGDLPADLAAAGLVPPIFRVELAGRQGSERVSIGQADGASVLAWRDGRPYLFVTDFGGSLPVYLQGRGVRLQGDGVDYRMLRPLTFSLHAARRLEIRDKQGVYLSLERNPDGEGWDLTRPWPVAVRDGSAETLFKALGDLKALSVYPREDRPPELTGLDEPAWTWEISVDGATRPMLLQAGRAKGQGIYMAVPGEDLVYYAPRETMPALIPEPLELASRLVLRLKPHQFQIVRLVTRDKTVRLDRNMDTGLFRLPGGGLAGDAWEELLEGLADLSALRLLSADAGALEREEGAITVLFHRARIDSTDQEPGVLVESVRLLQGPEGEVRAWRPTAPFVYQVPSRLWVLASRLL